MESLNHTSTFRFNSSDTEPETGFSGTLEIFVHHARNIHNICIYDNQDVYAKFSLTYNPDETISTQVVVGGGKNPRFDEKLELKVDQVDAVIKCEVWMLSRLRNLLEDQLLGFALVPISLIASHGGKITCQDFSLSSTDLFHSPAGTIQLSVSFSSKNSSPVSALNSSANPFPDFSGKSSISSEVVLLDRNEYSRVEFPDINAATQDQIMVSEYFNLNSDPSCIHHGSYLHLGSALRTRDDDYEMVGNSSEENEVSTNRNSAVSSSTTTSMSDDRNTADSSSFEKKSKSTLGETGVKLGKGDDCFGGVRAETESSSRKEKVSSYGNLGTVFSGRVGNNTSLEAEQVAMQQQIADMYMKSMQQFTESLAKMKIPMDLDPSPDGEDTGNVVKVEVESKKKDGSRVFYGSRAFF